MDVTNQISSAGTLDAKAISAAVVLSVVGVSGFLILPVLLDTIAKHFGFSESEVGYYAALTGAMAAVASLAAVVWVRRVNWRSAALVSLLLMGLGTGLATVADSFVTLTLAMMVTALGGGAAYSLALTILSDDPRAEQVFGYSVAAQVTFQVAGLLIFPWLSRNFGFTGVLYSLIILILLALLASRLLPERGLDKEDKKISHAIFSPAPLLALLGCFFFFVNVGGYWSYIGLMGTDAGLSEETVSNLLALGVSVGVLGALLASWSGERFGIVTPLVFCALGTIVSILVLSGGFSSSQFLASTATYNLVWNLSLTFQYAVVARVDNTGSSVAAAPSFHAAGGAAGPGIAAVLFPTLGFLTVHLLVAVSVTASLVLLVMALRTSEKEMANVIASKTPGA